MSGNQRDGVFVANDWRDYDALPAELREVVRRAPWNLATKLCTKDLPRDPRAARKELIAKIVRRIGVDCLSTYGSDHPQADASPTFVAPAWERKTGGGRAARA